MIKSSLLSLILYSCVNGDDSLIDYYTAWVKLCFVLKILVWFMTEQTEKRKHATLVIHWLQYPYDDGDQRCFRCCLTLRRCFLLGIHFLLKWQKVEKRALDKSLHDDKKSRFVQHFCKNGSCILDSMTSSLLKELAANIGMTTERKTLNKVKKAFRSHNELIATCNLCCRNERVLLRWTFCMLFVSHTRVNDERRTSSSSESLSDQRKHGWDDFKTNPSEDTFSQRFWQEKSWKLVKTCQHTIDVLSFVCQRRRLWEWHLPRD